MRFVVISAFFMLLLGLWAEAKPSFFIELEPACPETAECLPVTHCPAVVRAISSDSSYRPQRCDFRGFLEYVCCEKSGGGDGETEDYQFPPGKSSVATPRTTTESSRLQDQRLSPSQKACQEYNTDVDNFSNYLELKIVNGEEANEGEFPYMVAIGYASNKSRNLSWSCGGTLISDRYVLTAAHCITDTQARNLRPVALRVGVLRLDEGPRRPEDYAVDGVTVHPRYQPPQKYHDLALLRTDRRVAFSPVARPACLVAPAGDASSGRSGVAGANAEPLFAAGWGATDFTGFDMSPDLLKVGLQEVQQGECTELLGSQKTALPRGIDGSMLCAKGLRKGQDTCFGDSGGPLIRRGAVDTLVGVTSFGSNPCAGRRPGVYARVAPEMNWIESIVWP